MLSAVDRYPNDTNVVSARNPNMNSNTATLSTPHYYSWSLDQKEITMEELYPGATNTSYLSFRKSVNIREIDSKAFLIGIDSDNSCELHVSFAISYSIRNCYSIYVLRTY